MSILIVEPVVADTLSSSSSLSPAFILNVIGCLPAVLLNFVITCRKAGLEGLAESAGPGGGPGGGCDELDVAACCNVVDGGAGGAMLTSGAMTFVVTAVGC